MITKLLAQRALGKLDRIVKGVFSGRIELGLAEPSKTIEVKLTFKWDPSKTRITGSMVRYSVEFLCYPPGCIPTGDNFKIYFNGAEIASEAWWWTGGTRSKTVNAPNIANGENVFHIRVERCLGISPLTWVATVEWLIDYEGVPPAEPKTPEEQLATALWVMVISAAASLGASIAITTWRRRR